MCRFSFIQQVPLLKEICHPSCFVWVSKQRGGCGNPERSQRLLWHPLLHLWPWQIEHSKKSSGHKPGGSCSSQLLTDHQMLIYKEVKPAVCWLQRVRKLLPEFSGDFLPPLGQAHLEFRSLCHTHIILVRTALIYCRLTPSCAHGLWHSQTLHSSSNTWSKSLSGAHSSPQCNAQVAALGLLSRINAQFVEEVRSFHSFFPVVLWWGQAQLWIHCS